jgi:hypothetical protein
MNTNQLNCYLKNTKTTVCASDQIKCEPLKHFPSRFIINSDEISQPGTHWIGLIFIKNSENLIDAIYLDSLGAPPVLYPIVELINLNVTGTLYVNKHPLQLPDHETCGQFALLFVTHCKNKQTFIEFLSTFSTSDFEANDSKVRQFFNNWIGLNV